MRNKLYNFDIAIIGAGPVGLFAVFQAGMLGLRTCVIDSLETIGGQCSALYPEKPIYDIPGYPKILAQELIEKLYEQALPFAANFFLNQQAIGLQKINNLFCIKTSKNIEIKAKTVIIAAGSGAFGPNKPPIDNIRDFEGKSVFYLVKNRNDFANKTIVIAGGGDSAADWAISLSEIAKKIYVVHRRDKFKAAPETIRKIHDLATKGLIELVIPYQLQSLHGKNGILEEVHVADLENMTKIIEADILLSFFGLSMQLGPILQWGIELYKKNIVTNQTTMQTNIPGIFAIGDIVNYPGKLKLILTGFAEAAIACHNIHNIIYPEKALHFEYSTTKGIPLNTID